MKNRLDQTYYYDQQIRRYILQFMALFSVFKVSVGVDDEGNTKFASVPIHFASQDRVVASILAQNTQNTPIRLPAMSVYIRDIKTAPERYHGQGTERRQAYVPVGGLVPDDIEVVHQRMPVPYTITVELSIHVSNLDQHWQLLEQILPLFNPQLEFQNSDGLFDWTRLTSITLTGLSLEDLISQETTSRVIQSTLTFDVAAYFDFPSNVRKDYIAKIFTRIGVVSSLATSDADILQQLDEGGFDYEKLLDANDLPFD